MVRVELVDVIKRRVIACRVRGFRRFGLRLRAGDNGYVSGWLALSRGETVFFHASQIVQAQL